MFDHDTLIISYDRQRGEGSKGRARLGKGLKTREERQAQGVGDCIDCGYCVQVCPRAQGPEVFVGNRSRSTPGLMPRQDKSTEPARFWSD